MLGAAVAVAVTLSEIGVVSPGFLAVVVIAAGHGALLASALAWAGVARPVALSAIAILGVAALAARAHPLGALAYLAVPVWLFGLARAGRLEALGLGSRCPPGAIVLGALAGVFLGVHVLVSATLTFGYRPRLDVDVMISWLLFDVGAHLPGTGAFFIGGLFNRAQRAWSLGLATIAVTLVLVLRYLVDPLLPHAVELIVGTVFYVSLLSVTACWLFWRFGSLIPPLVTWLVFFTAYRTLRAE